MLYLPDSVISEIEKDDNKIIELSGLPDAGTSSASMFILKELDGYGLYIGHQQNTSQIELYKHYLGDDADRVLVTILDEPEPTKETLLKYIHFLGAEVDTIIIDNFAYYILNRPRPYIKNLISLLYSKAIELNTRIIIINQLRYDVYNHHEANTMAPLKTLYKDYLSQHVDLRLECHRSEENNQDIYIEIARKDSPKKEESLLSKTVRNILSK